MLFAVTGALSTCASIIPDPNGPSSYKLSAIYVLVSVVCLGVSNAIYNAYLPLLVDADASLYQLRNEERKAPSINGISNLNKKQENVTDALSSNSSNAGYIGGFLTAIAVALILKFVKAPYSFKGALILTGIWWLLFTIPSMIYLKPRSGIPLPPKSIHILYSFKSSIKIYLFMI